jgi:hypothetical protein
MPDPDRRPWAATRQALSDQLGQLDGLLPGSVVHRRMRCGKPACACQNDPSARHGPYIQWTHTVDGKTVTRLLTPDELARYHDWFDNARRVKELVAKLETVCVRALDAEQRRGRANREPARPPRRRPRSGA